MNLAHIHIILNHVPSLGSIAGLLLLAAGIYKKDEALKQFAYGVLVLITMAVLPTYITGAESQRIVDKNPSYSAGMVQLHQNAAMITLLCMTAAGMFAWLGIWEYRRHSRSGPLTTMATLISTMAAVAAVLVTASIGGKISHLEIREAADAAVTEAVGWRLPIERFVNEHAFAWPTLEMIHYVGMAFLFGVSTVYLFRMLGIMKGISFPALHRLLPVAIIGFVLNTITGHDLLCRFAPALPRETGIPHENAGNPYRDGSHSVFHNVRQAMESAGGRRCSRRGATCCSGDFRVSGCRNDLRTISSLAGLRTV